MYLSPLSRECGRNKKLQNMNWNRAEVMNRQFSWVTSILRHRSVCSTAFALLLCAASPANTASLTWVGGSSGAETNWNTSANWSSSAAAVVVPTSLDDVVFSTSINNSAPTLSLDGYAHGISFSSDTTTRFTIGGSAQTLNIYRGGIVNNAAYNQTFSVSTLALQAAQTWDAASGTLTFSGTSVTLTLGANTLTVRGAFDTSIANAISGAAGITKTGAGTLTLGGNNTYGGSTTINAGTLALTSSGSIANTPVISIAGGATCDVSSATTATLGAGQTLQVSASRSTATLKTASGRGLQLDALSPLMFTAFTPGSVPPLTLSGAGTLTLGASSPVTVTVANNGTPLSVAGSPYKLIAKGASGTVATLPGGALTVKGGGVAGVASLAITGGELYLVVSPGPADHLVSIQGDGQSATVNTAVGINPMVQVVDYYGNAVSGTSINFTVLTGGGRVGTTPVSSDTSGYASTGYTMGTVSGTGNNTMRAESVTTLPGSPATITFTESATAGAADHLISAAGEGQNATVNTAVGTNPKVQVVDSYGNAVSGISIKFTVLTGGGRVGTTPATSDASGIASTSYTLGTVSGTGINTMKAEGVTALPGNPAMITFTESAMPETASKLVFTIEPARMIIDNIGSCRRVFSGRVAPR